MKLDNFLNVSMVLAFAVVTLYSHVAEGQKSVNEPIETVNAPSQPKAEISSLATKKY